ncbi:hypothetical protein SAMN02745704_02850 [Paucidesulfovibrio gracilis DSM 16080]|uniref:Phage MuF C-terminal domain-containing protein n=1 Tax=Paucidesulfovibrio gracilis DSM 16080 TaxID=1121449 RepID=A0A1T4Y740_9BACT|nr:hypothetical protein [Paucidesulfovibrio gracilis]SKA97493.1 hypothetical protein SAMN02745704_02850 [Paucidesulfovibrio gracilis DSM 16080]
MIRSSRLLAHTLSGRCAKPLALVIAPGKLHTLMDEHPEITPEVVKQIPSALADPIMIFDSATQAGRLVVMLDLKGEDGSTVMVPIELDVVKDHHRVNVLTSVYGNRPGWFLGQIEAGNLRYQDKKKSRSWANQHRLQLPPGAPLNGSGKKYTLRATLSICVSGMNRCTRGLRAQRKFDLTDTSSTCSRTRMPPHRSTKWRTSFLKKWADLWMGGTRPRLGKMIILPPASGFLISIVTKP